MKTKVKQSGLTLTEQIVVVAAIATLVSFGLPAIRSFVDSMESSGAARAMINSAFASAKAIAAKEQKYAGIRFQHEYNPDTGDPLEASQYMILIIHDFDGTGLENGVRAVEGIEPVKLPSSICVMDLKDNDNDIELDTDIDGDAELRDTTAFSILFSPSGKLVIHDVQVRNRDGYPKNNNNSDDDIFNTKYNVEDKKIAMFLQDDYGNEGYQKELSRKSFIICNRFDLKQAPKGKRYSEYIEQIKDSAMIYINPYTGRMIKQK